MSATELARTAVRRADDVIQARQLARTAAALLGLKEVDQTRVATAVSEAARVLVEERVTATLLVVSEPRELVVQLLVEGELPASLRPGGTGHLSSVRLMDEVRSDATSLCLRKALPGAEPDLAAVRGRLAALLPSEPLLVLREQNAELTEALSALRDREADLVRLNLELEETNRGVVALYAELEQSAEQVRRAQRLVFEELEGALRPPPPQVPGVELGVRYLPAQVDSPTGGDLYDWRLLQDGELHLAVVDAVGHGVSSTRDALAVTHAVRTLTLEGHRVGDVLQTADELLTTSDADDEVVATALLARLDVATGRLRVAGGGHPPALLVHPSGSARYLEADGRPIGYPSAGSDDVAEAQLCPGEVVLLYTDGLIELGRDVVRGLADLSDVAADAAGRPLEELLDAVLSGAAAGRPFRDDTLVLAVRWLGLPVLPEAQRVRRTGSGRGGDRTPDHPLVRRALYR